LMKGLSRDRLLQTNFSSDSFLHASGAGGRGKKDDSIWSSYT
jgi:hypothetical protein